MAHTLSTSQQQQTLKSCAVGWQAKQRLIVRVFSHLVQLGAAVCNTLHIKLYDQMDQSISLVYIIHRPGKVVLCETLSGSENALSTDCKLVNGT